MAKPKMVPGTISRKRVGYVESSADAYVMLEWARARALSSKPQELRVVVSPEIAPQVAPDIVAILRIRGYEARDADEVFRKAVAKSSSEEDLLITVLNPRVLFFKEKALKMLNDRRKQAYTSRIGARIRLKSIYADLNRVEAETRATNCRIVDLKHKITTILLIRAACKATPLHLPGRITPEYLRLHYAFLIDPLFPEANPPVLKLAADMAEDIVHLRASLGLPPAGGEIEVSNLLSSYKAELAMQARKLVTLDTDKSVLCAEVAMEEAAIKNLDIIIPRLMALMTTKSTYGADGIEEEGRPVGQATRDGRVSRVPGVAGEAAADGSNVAST